MIRYTLEKDEGCGYICEDIDGEYVRYEDHAAEVNRIVAEKNGHYDALVAHNQELAASFAQPEELSAEVARITEAEAAQLLDDGFSIKVLNQGSGFGSYWRCPYCTMPDYEGHEQSCLIRALVERLLGRHIPFGKLPAVSTQGTRGGAVNDFEIMQRCRLKWVREVGQNTNLPMPSEQALAAYHRGFLDALAVALAKVINDDALLSRKPQLHDGSEK